MPIQNPKSKIQNRKGRVIVVGSSNTDLVVRCDTLPRAGETVLGGDMETFAGGKGANQAVAAARAGAKVFFIGAFGDDAFGRARRADLEREGIDCSGCVIKKGVPSGVALIAVGSSGKGKGRAKAENQILVAPGANARLTANDIRRGMPKFLHIEDVMLCSMEIPIEAVDSAVTLGWQSTGLTQVILNPAPLPDKKFRKHLFRRCHFVTPNETEFEDIVSAKAGTVDAMRKAQKFLRQIKAPGCYPQFIVTRGANGVQNYDKYDSFLEHQVPEMKVVDTVGAGDCFNGCLAAALSLDDSDLDFAIRFAIAASAIQVTRCGAQAAMPYRNEILKMLKRMKP